VDLPDEKIFHMVITDQEFVQQVYAVISSLQPVGVGGSKPFRPEYSYHLRFATDTMTTLMYRGTSVGGWALDNTVSIINAPSPVNPPLYELMQTLHTRFGMPYWRAEDDPLGWHPKQ
jgi:hypothetical protein